MSEGASDCCLMPTEQCFSYIMARTNYIRWEHDDVRFLQDHRLSWIFVIVQVHWNTSPRVDMSLHPDTLSRFWCKQFVPLLINTMCLAEKQTPILLYLGWPIRVSCDPTVPKAKVNAIRYTTDADPLDMRRLHR